MQTFTAQTSIAAGRSVVWCALLALVRDTWDVTDDDVVASDAPARLVHGIVLDGETSCWLTWELAPDGAATTVGLVHDELVAGPAPDLDGVLEMLRATVPAHLPGVREG